MSTVVCPSTRCTFRFLWVTYNLSSLTSGRNLLRPRDRPRSCSEKKPVDFALASSIDDYTLPGYNRCEPEYHRLFRVPVERKGRVESELDIKVKKTYGAFLWHGFFLALTMSMLDLNTVFPSLLDQLTPSKMVFGVLYSIMLGVPLLFNVVFSHYLRWHRQKKKFLLMGIYLRSF